MPTHHRRSIRLRGYDYSDPGRYFVTICTNGRTCILGKVAAMRFYPSAIGKLVQQCWNEIPDHFPHAHGSVVQIMPNHVHGIITIADKPAGVEYIQPLQGPRKEKRIASYQHVVPGSLGSIIRTFKAAVTREVNRKAMKHGRTLWQRNFYDHIIRDDTSCFYIERYIERNPLLWHLDVENPMTTNDAPTLDAVRVYLQKELHLDPAAVEYLVEREIDYKLWRRRNS